ncbi:hypothetical protein DSM107007_22300 [Nostoc sp. PCC 7120 = FACHB-418]|nr:hypothetical protein DSM107007_22300 [Nostoc sp. PCC 7120 = FACHB-418]BAB75577.1 asr3878 [Nostoc sp. PCC 7120 = FACHB-418]
MFSWFNGDNIALYQFPIHNSLRLANANAIKKVIGIIIMFGLGWPEIAIIVVVAVVIFGPKKIPELGSALGKTLRGFKDELKTPSEDTNPEEEK